MFDLTETLSQQDVHIAKGDRPRINHLDLDGMIQTATEMTCMSLASMPGLPRFLFFGLHSVKYPPPFIVHWFVFSTILNKKMGEVWE